MGSFLACLFFPYNWLCSPDIRFPPPNMVNTGIMER